MKPLADEDKNFAGFIAGKLLDRSMLETTNISQGTPGNVEAIFTSGYLRLTIRKIRLFVLYCYAISLLWNVAREKKG